VRRAERNIGTHQGCTEFGPSDVLHLFGKPVEQACEALRRRGVSLDADRGAVGGLGSEGIVRKAFQAFEVQVAMVVAPLCDARRQALGESFFFSRRGCDVTEEFQGVLPGKALGFFSL